jgi:hypothetical protein
MPLPYRQQEILQTLKDNPNSSTAEVFKIAKSKPGSELPDTNITSKLIYSLRGNELIKSHDAAGSQRHNITPKGLAELEKQIKEDEQALADLHKKPVAEKETPEKPADPGSTRKEMSPWQKFSDKKIESVTFDMSDELDSALHRLVLLIQASATSSVTIERKPEKLQLLSDLHNTELLSGPIRSLLLSIKNDIAALDAF